jgi:uncharacterized membrane-anchored protein
MPKEGDPKPAPNLGNEELLKKFGLVYQKDENGNVRLLTQDGGVPSDEQLRQYTAEAARQHREMSEIIRQRIRRIEKKQRNNRNEREK